MERPRSSLEKNQTIALEMEIGSVVRGTVHSCNYSWDVRHSLLPGAFKKPNRFYDLLFG